ncbi:hypothetical protein P5V15_012891 [Pogonomyrmex californicus]
MVKATTNEMRELYDSWEKALSKEELFYPRNRSEICKGSREIKEVLAYEFVRKYFTNDVLEIAIKMFNEIEEEMEYLIQNSDWLNDKGKNFASAKLKNMKKMIGYRIGTKYFNHTGLLSRIVSAANFENPWFACGQPQALNYGMVGAIMGHEVNHGFDDQGYMYDKDGTFLGWFSAMADAYDKKKDCFVEQFNNYPIDTKTNKKIKDYGEQTTGDNIADTMGLQAIFKAYQSNQKKNNTTDAILPGLEDFTSNQLFFLGFANSWCEAIKSDKLMTIAENDEHSIARLRVIGSVSNSDDFAEAYNCLVGSPMNPEKKCNIWNQNEEENEEKTKGESGSDEDPSDEEKQSNEGKDEPENEDENDLQIDINVDVNDKNDDDDDCNDCNNCGEGSGDNDEDDDDDDDDDNDDDDDDDDDDNDYDDDDIKKRINKKKITGKIAHRRNKKLRHIGQTKNEVVKKQSIHKTKKQRTKRWAKATDIHSKQMQRVNSHKKLHVQKSQRKHLKKIFRNTKKILDNIDTMSSWINTEDIINADKIVEYSNYVLNVANIIAKGMDIDTSEERLTNDIKNIMGLVGFVVWRVCVCQLDGFYVHHRRSRASAVALTLPSAVCFLYVRKAEWATGKGKLRAGFPNKATFMGTFLYS